MTFTGLTPLLNSLIANGSCIFFADYRSGSLMSRVGGYPGTINGTSRLQKGSLTGGAISGTTFVEYATAPSIPSNCTVVAIYTPRAKGTRLPAIIQDGKFSFNLTMGTGRFGATSDSATHTLSSVNALTIQRKNIIAVTRMPDPADPANKTKINHYVDGVLTGSADQNGGPITAGTTAIKVCIAENGSALGCVLLFSVILTPAELLTLTDELDNQIRYETQDCFWPVSATVYWRGAFGALASETAMAAGRSIGDINELVVASGTHKMSTEKLDGILTKCLVCVTNGTINLPAYNLGANYVFEKFTASTGLWTTVTQASRTVALLAGDKILWANQIGNRYIKRIY